MQTTKKTVRRQVRHARVRARVAGTAERPRLCVYRSNTFTYAQIIDDVSGKTLASASDLKLKDGTKMERAGKVGKEIGQKAKAAKVDAVVFDRGGYNYHGRVKAVAEAAREAGLKF